MRCPTPTTKEYKATDIQEIREHKMLFYWRLVESQHRYTNTSHQSMAPSIYYSIELVLIKLAYETNHQRFDKNTLAFIRVIEKMHTETSLYSYVCYLDNAHAYAYEYYVIACHYTRSHKYYFLKALSIETHNIIVYAIIMSFFSQLCPQHTSFSIFLSFVIIRR